MTSKSRLHIPKPTARPGDEPDFSYLDLSPAGSVDKPPIDARTRDMEYLANDLVRVLDDNNEAQGPWDERSGPADRDVRIHTVLHQEVGERHPARCSCRMG